MKTINTILRELFGLFVDDGSLALAILALLAVIALLVFEAVVTTESGGGTAGGRKHRVARRECRAQQCPGLSMPIATPVRRDFPKTSGSLVVAFSLAPCC